MQLEHVNFTVADLDKAVHFYATLLDLRVRWSGLSGNGYRVVHLGDDNQYLAIFEAAPDKKDLAARPDYDRPGLNHVGFVVDDLELIRSRLVDLGVTPHHEADYEPGTRIYCFDHDDIEVEFISYA